MTKKGCRCRYLVAGRWLLAADAGAMQLVVVVEVEISLCGRDPVQCGTVRVLW